MHQTFKAGQWYFGMKTHIGVDSATGLIRSASVTAYASGERTLKDYRYREIVCTMAVGKKAAV